MHEEFEIRILSPQPAIAETAFTTRPEIGPTLGRIFPRLAASVSDELVAGAPYARYLTMSEQGFDLEAGLPLKRGGTTTLPGGPAAFTTHVGPYEQLPATHEALGAWLHQQGWEVAGPPWESYVSDPGANPDPGTWRTEIYLPVKRPG